MPNSDTSRPIILHPTEIRATQIRRVVTPKIGGLHGLSFWGYDSDGCAMFGDAPGYCPQRVRCPYTVGSQLWVRETWRVGAWDSSTQSIAVDYRDGARRQWLHVSDYDQFEKLWIASTDQAMAAGLPLDENGGYRWKPGEAPTVWRPPLTMPRWASRLTLEVVGVRVERLQAITEEEAIAAGFDPAPVHGQWVTRSREEGGHWSARKPFSEAWDARNAAHPWSSDPWVWVLDVRRVD